MRAPSFTGPFNRRWHLWPTVVRCKFQRKNLCLQSEKRADRSPDFRKILGVTCAVTSSFSFYETKLFNGHYLEESGIFGWWIIQLKIFFLISTWHLAEIVPMGQNFDPQNPGFPAYLQKDAQSAESIKRFSRLTIFNIAITAVERLSDAHPFRKSFANSSSSVIGPKKI